jgi:hypothetical protein
MGRGSSQEVEAAKGGLAKPAIIDYNRISKADGPCLIRASVVKER